MKLNIIRGATSRTLLIFVQDSTSTTGAGLTGLVFNTAGLFGTYYREKSGGATPIVLATSTLGTWASGAFIEVNASTMPGVYEIGIPDAALSATGNLDFVTIFYGGAANMAPVVLEIALTSAGSDVNVVSWLGTAVTAGTAGVPNVDCVRINNQTTSAAGSVTFPTGATIASQTNVDLIKTKTDFLPSATAGAAGGVFIAGTNAPVTITGSGSALTLTSTGANGSGLTLNGNGSGHGINALAGATGIGILGAGGITSGSGISGVATGGNSNGIAASGLGTGHGMSLTGGATGTGLRLIGGATSGAAMQASATSGNGITITTAGGNGAGISATGNGSGHGMNLISGATGHGIYAQGGVTSGHGIYALGLTSGNGITAQSSTLGHGMSLIAAGASRHGLLATSSNSGVSDGISAVVAGGTGVPIRGDLTGNITGNLSGSIGSLGTGAITSTTFAAGAITATSIAANALDGKGDWNIGKTGYTLTTADKQALIELYFTFDATANYASSVTGSLVKEVVTNVATGGGATAQQIWEYDVAGMPDVAGQAGPHLVSIKTSSAAIKAKTDSMTFTNANQLDSRVITMADNSLTADAAAADFIGASEIAASAGQEIADLIAADWIAGDASPLAIVAALKADAQWSNLATIASNLSSVKTKTDFLPSATAGAAGGVFIAGTNAATTFNNTGTWTGNIDGTVSTVTTLSNLPAIPANWITAAGITAGAMNGKGDWNIGKTGYTLTTADKQALIELYFTFDATADYAGAVTGSLVKEVVTNVATGGGATPQQIWEYNVAGMPDVAGQAGPHLVAIKTSGAAIKTKTDFLPSSTAGSAGGVFIAGTNAPVTITGSGDALTLTSTGANGRGLVATGNGSGSGMRTNGGATGSGMFAQGGATSGYGMRYEGGPSFAGLYAIGGSGAAGAQFVGGSNQAGMHCEGTGNGNGLNAKGGPTGGHGIRALGGAVSGNGMMAEANTEGHGFELVAVGTAKNGILTTGGTTGDGLNAQGGATGGSGIYAKANAATNNGFWAQGNTSGNGIYAQSGTSGNGLYCLAGSAGGSGIRAQAASSGTHGIHASGTTSGSGLYGVGGSTGSGALFSGGTTSGNGITATASLGHGMSLTGAGAARHGLLATSGASGVSDGISAVVAGGTGVPIRGDLTGNITGNLSGSVASVTNSVTTTTADKHALIELYFTFDATADYAGSVAGSLVKEVVTNVATGGGATPQQIWEYDVAGMPDVAGQAGPHLVAIKTSGAAIKAKTDSMTFTNANQLDSRVITMADNSLTADAAAADFIGASEIAASASQEIADLIAADWVAGDASPLAILQAFKNDTDWLAQTVWSAPIATYSIVLGSTAAALADTKGTVLTIDNNTQTLFNEWEDNGRLDNLLDLAAAAASSTELSNAVTSIQTYGDTVGLWGAVGSGGGGGGNLVTGATSFTLFSGTVVSGTFADTVGADDVEHRIQDSAGTTNIEYGFNIGLDAKPASLKVVARLNGNNDNIDVQAWDWDLGAWNTLFNIIGISNTPNAIYNVELLQSHVGKEADSGKVRIRFFNNSLTASNLYVDQILVGFVPQNVPYVFKGIAASGTTSTIVLGSEASALDNYYFPALAVIKTGTGAGQSARVSGYVGSTRTVTVATPFITAPDSTSVIEILPWASVRVTEMDTTVLNGIGNSVWTVDLDPIPDVAGRAASYVKTIDLKATAIKNKTDVITFTTGLVDSHIKTIANDAITGDATDATFGSKTALAIYSTDITPFAIVPNTAGNSIYKSFYHTTVPSGRTELFEHFLNLNPASYSFDPDTYGLLFWTLTAGMNDITVGAPPANPSPQVASMYLYSALKNKGESDKPTDEKRFFTPAGTVAWKKPIVRSVDTYTELAGVSGP